MSWKVVAFLIFTSVAASAQTISVPPLPPLTSEPTKASGDDDPTGLTIQAIRREILGLRELMEAKLKGEVDRITQRMDDGDEGIKLIQAKADKVPTETDIAVTSLKNWIQAKLEGIERQFQNAAENAVQNETKNKTAIDAALEAQAKLAAQQTQGNADISAKSEASFIKAFDQIASLVAVNNNNLATRIGELGDRLTRIEGNTSGQKDNTAFIIAMVSLAVTVLSGIGMVLALLSRRAPEPVVKYVEVPATNGSRLK